jgi:membrane protein YdbS with pleckstrin-like domain
MLNFKVASRTRAGAEGSADLPTGGLNISGRLRIENMFCNQCGQPVTQGSRFCNHCGAQVAAPGNRPERGPRAGGQAASDAPALAGYGPTGMVDEQVIFTVRPTMIFVLVWYAIAALVVLSASALVGLLHSYWQQWVTDWVAFFVILGVGLVAFSIPVYKHIMRRREVYTLTNHKLEMRYGLIAKTVQNIPLRNIQEVTVNASVMQRLLKLGDVMVESASEMGTTKLAEIHKPDHYASLILAELRRRN